MQKQTKQTSSSPQTGRVIAYFGNSVAVETAAGQVFPCYLRRNQALPVVGDEVTFTQDDAKPTEAGVIIGIEPRRSVLMRGGQMGKQKPIAANIDYLIIVMAPSPIFSASLVDRYIVAAEILKIKPIIVLNKEDLLTEDNRSLAEKQLAPYRHIPYPVFLTSIYKAPTLETLANQIKDHTAVLVGPSGVGKSSIINALGAQSIKVGEVTAKGGGKHTTTATRLYHLPGGGNLIDSPGVRDFSLWAVTKQEVLKGFREFNAHHAGCKFRDCIHVAEPGCAVQAAVQNGNIAPERYASYQLFMKEIKK